MSDCNSHWPGSCAALDCDLMLSFLTLALQLEVTSGTCWERQFGEEKKKSASVLQCRRRLNQSSRGRGKKQVLEDGVPLLDLLSNNQPRQWLSRAIQPSSGKPINTNRVFSIGPLFPFGMHRFFSLMLYSVCPRSGTASPRQPSAPSTSAPSRRCSEGPSSSRRTRAQPGCPTPTPTRTFR